MWISRISRVLRTTCASSTGLVITSVFGTTFAGRTERTNRHEARRFLRGSPAGGACSSLARAAMEGAARKRCSRTAPARARSIAFSAISSEYDAQPIHITSSAATRNRLPQRASQMQTAKGRQQFCGPTRPLHRNGPFVRCLVVEMEPWVKPNDEKRRAVHLWNWIPRPTVLLDTDRLSQEAGVY